MTILLKCIAARVLRVVVMGWVSMLMISDVCERTMLQSSSRKGYMLSVIVPDESYCCCRASSRIESRRPSIGPHGEMGQVQQ